MKGLVVLALIASSIASAGDDDLFSVRTSKPFSVNQMELNPEFRRHDVDVYTLPSVAGCLIKKTYPLIEVYASPITGSSGDYVYLEELKKKAKSLGANAVLATTVVRSTREIIYANGTPVLLECGK